MLQHQLQYAKGKLLSMIEDAVGNEFEKLFHHLMELRHDDYMVIRTHGNIGDLGGDGYRTSTRQLYACYAPESFDVSEVRGKFRSDLESAIIHRPEQFETFVFVHNDRRGGIHPVISGVLANARTDHPHISFQQMGPRKLWIEASYLDRHKMEDLLGERIPVDLVAYSIGMADIEPLLKHMAESRRRLVTVEPIPLPTTHKADFNRLSQYDRDSLQAGRPYSYLVEQYYRGGLDVHERDEVANGFRAHYEQMHIAYGDDSDEIMHQMRCYVLGQEMARQARDEAAKAVLAYFFDECDIFEVPPPGWEPARTGRGGAA
ncbi:ABC-three component system protein [Nocardia sp. NPDC004604]|uniref:ABC-three component system protein n=1 Tax=Nocardia sp. NPDC004604 TaxID=3157013 RepID=UPI0033B5702C